MTTIASAGSALWSRWGVMLCVAMLVAAAILPPLAGAAVIALVIGGILVLHFPGIGLVLLLVSVIANAANVATNVQGLPIFSALLIPVLAAVAVIGKLRNGDDTRMEQWVAVTAAIYVALQSISLFWVVDLEPTTLALEQMVKDWVFVLLIVAFVPSVRELRLAVRAMAYTGGAIALLGVVQYATGSFDSDFLGFANASVKQISGDIRSWRLSGPFPDSNYFGQALVMTLPLAVGLCVIDRRPSLRLFNWICVATILAAIVLTFSRGALGAVVVMALAAILLMRARWHVLAALCVVSLLGIAAAPQQVLDRFASIAQAVRALLFGGQVIEDPSLGGRIAVMTAALDMFKDHPLLGIGLAQYEVAYGDYALAKGLDPGAPPHAHSLYLEIAAEGGLLGLAAFLALAGGAAAIAVWGISRLRARGQAAGAVMGVSIAIGFIGYLATSLFLHDAFPRLFYVEIGLLLAVGHVALANHGNDLSDIGKSGRDVMQANLRDHPFPPVDIFSMLWRAKWLIVLFAIAGALLSGFYTLTAPRKYMAESTLLYRFGREYSPILPGEQGRSWGESIQVSLDTALFTEMRLLENGDVLKEAARAIGPDLLASTEGTSVFGLTDLESSIEALSPFPNRGVPRSRDAVAVQHLMDMLTVRRVEGTAMLTVAVRHANPQVAERAVDAVVTAYRAQRRDLFNRNAADFYSGQINETQAQLAAIQAKKAALVKEQSAAEQSPQDAILLPTNDEVNSGIAAARDGTQDLDAIRSQLDVLDIQRNAAAANLSRLIDLRDRSAVDASYADSVEPSVEVVQNAAGDATPIGGSLTMRIGLGLAFGAAIGLAYVLLSALARRRPLIAVEPV